MLNAVFIWLLSSLFFLILELGHPGLLFFLSFSMSSAVAALAAYHHHSLPTQLSLFFGSTFIALLFFRLFLKKFHRSIHTTNVYALIGKTGIIVQKISHQQPGYVKVQGEMWLARSSNNALDVGTHVIVTNVQGAHLVVEQKNIHTL